MVALNIDKNGGWIARKVIPADARLEYKRLYGVRREAVLRVPKGTSKLQAKATFAQWLIEVETRIERIRAVAAGEGQPLTVRDAQALSGRWYHFFLARHDDDPGSVEYWADRKEHLTERVWYPHAPLEHLDDPHADASWPWTQSPEVREAVRPEVAEMALAATFLAREGLALTAEAHRLFIDAVAERLFTAYAVLERRAFGDYTRDAYPDTFPTYVEKRRGVTTGMDCWQLFGAYVSARQPAPGTVSRWRAVIKHLQAAYPGSAGDLTEAQARAWRDTLVTPKRRPVTVDAVWLPAASTVFAWGVAQKHINANPFADVKIDVPKAIQLREDGRAFKPAEAKVILRASAAITNMRDAFPRAKRWAMWLCAYSGARAGEITQLRGADVTAREGFYVMRLTPEAGSIKTGEARTVPLHEHLIEQGFIEFVRAQGEGPLFYNVRRAKTTEADPLNPPHPPSIKTRGRLGYWVRQLGISDPQVGPTHGWRHLFQQIADRAGIAEKMSDRITGHKPASTARRYGPATVDDMAEALKKFPRYIL